MSQESKEAWSLIKSKMTTDRSIEFLQKRYKKLLSNQKFTAKDLNLFYLTYSKFSMSKLQIIYPGKTEKTLANLIQDFESNAQQQEIKQKKVDLELHSSDNPNQYVIGRS